MTEAGKVNLRNKIVYGAIAGAVGGPVLIIVQLLVSSLNLGNYDDIDSSSQRWLGTAPGDPYLVGYVILGMVIAVVLGIIYGIILFLVMTRAGWERDLTRYLLVALVLGVVFFPVDLIVAITSTPEYDLLVDGSIGLMMTLIAVLLTALIVYYLEERFGSAS